MLLELKLTLLLQLKVLQLHIELDVAERLVGGYLLRRWLHWALHCGHAGRRHWRGREAHMLRQIKLLLRGCAHTGREVRCMGLGVRLGLGLSLSLGMGTGLGLGLAALHRCLRAERTSFTGQTGLQCLSDLSLLACFLSDSAFAFASGPCRRGQGSGARVHGHGARAARRRMAAEDRGSRIARSSRVLSPSLVSTL